MTTEGVSDGRIRVFLVDDVRELRVLLRMVLEEDPGMEVVGEASDGRAGVEGVERARPDVVLLDLSMPDMDGLEAIPLIRERAPETRIVVLSGHEPGRVSLEALGQGATRYVNKASNLEQIRGAVREVARLQEPFTDERFEVVRRMWTHYLNGNLLGVVEEVDPEVVWLSLDGTQANSPQELFDLLARLRASGRVRDPRPHGVERYGAGLIVIGTVRLGAGSPDETLIHWGVCFRRGRVALAAGCARREYAQRTIDERCAA